MQQLNKARVQLKHHGLLPDRKDVQDFLPRVEGFFENVLREYCNVDYASLSLIDALEDKEVRRLLGDSRRKFDSGDTSAAMLDLAIAFERVQRPGKGKRLPLLEPPPKPRLSREIATWDNQQVVDKLYHFFYSCTAQINAQMVGVNLMEWARFRRFTPYVQVDENGTPFPSPGFQQGASLITREDYEDCVAFLIDYGIRAARLYVGGRSKPEAPNT